ncbi:ABC transporter permease [Thorsellia kenyensis]|uniref:ABC transporter permease n=1 Tax=Thorsellia kenyensis TaxID=1549888 RepID=A0ABV6CBA5_9GAMM
MNTILFYVSNMLILYALSLLVITWLTRPIDIAYVFKNLIKQKRRSSITLSAIVLGGVAIFIFGGFINYSYWSVREQTIRSNLGHIQIFAKGALTSGVDTNLQYTLDNYQEIKKILMQDEQLKPLIETVTGQLNFSGIISFYDNSQSTFFNGLGIEADKSLILGSFDTVVSGSDLSKVRPFEITVGSGLASKLGVKYGDYVEMLVVNPEGGQNAASHQLRGIFKSGLKEYDDTWLKMPLETAQSLMQTENVSKVIIVLKDTENTDLAYKRIQTLLKGHKIEADIRNWEQLAINYQQVVNFFEGIFLFIKVIVSIIVIFMIGNTLMMNVVERTKEIATLRALGLPKKRVRRLFVLEGVFIGIFGAGISLSLGIFLSWLINLNGLPMKPAPGYTEGYLAFILWKDNPSLIWFTCALPLVTALLASIIPSNKAASLLIAKAFRFN